MTYRKDIDGLRAIAVIAVILYHLDFYLVPGGFLGVDIFFVISGYLITQSIRADIHGNKFTIANFYIKRIRRIIPALFFIVLATIILSLYILPKSELDEFAKSVISVGTFTSNIFFWRHIDYFSVAAELKPLLHTWSLGIEEQYYIVFPIFMLLTKNSPDKQIKFWITILLVASFIVHVSPIGTNHPAANFYLPYTRFWELLIGSLLALSVNNIRFSKAYTNAISLLGLTFILFSIAYDTGFPGTNALFATIGTALVIYAGNGQINFLTIALSNNYIRYIGLISYSLYLWHWPIIALAKNSYIGEFTTAIQLSIVAITFALSALTYTFVEQPFRKNQKPRDFLQLKTGAFALMILVFIASLMLMYTKIHYQTHEQSQINTCFENEETLDSTIRCSFGVINSDKVFFLYGDSHASVMYPAFERLALDNGWRGIYASFLGCAPLFNVFRLDGTDNASDCSGSYSSNVEKFLVANQHNIGKVFLVSRWTIYEKGWIKHGRLQKATHFLSDNDTTSINPIDSSKVLAKGLFRTIDKITDELNIQTNLLLSVPVLPSSKITSVSVSKEEYINQRKFIDSIFIKLEQNPLVEIIDPIDIFCPTDVCSTYDQGKLLYMDDNHVSTEGSLLLYPLLLSVFNESDSQ